MISESLWRNRLSAADVVGRVIRYNGRPVQIVGIAPATFSGQLDRAELWMPYTTRGYLGLGPDEPSAPNAIRLNLDGRLRPGYSRSDVRAEIRVLAARQDRLRPGRHTVPWITDGSLLQKPGNTAVVVAVVALTLAALTCLALVACSNVVSLLVARADARQREMAMRTALGADGPRLVRMLLTETLLLACVAGIIATYIAYRSPRLLLDWIVQRSAGFPIQPRWTVFTFLALLTVLLGVVAAVAPARAALALDVVDCAQRTPQQRATRPQAGYAARRRPDVRGGDAAGRGGGARANSDARRLGTAALRDAAGDDAESRSR